MKFAENINKLLTDGDISNYRLAKDLGISEASVRSWRSGEHEPVPKTRKKLAKYFGITEDELYLTQIPTGNKNHQHLTASERDLLEKYRQLSHADREVLIGMADMLASKQGVKKKAPRHRIIIPQEEINEALAEVDRLQAERKAGQKLHGDLRQRRGQRFSGRAG